MLCEETDHRFIQGTCEPGTERNRRGRLVNTSSSLGRVVTNFLRDLGAHGVYVRHWISGRALPSTSEADPSTATEAVNASMDIELLDYLHVHLRDRQNALTG